MGQILGERPHLALPSNQPGGSGPLQLLHLLGQLLVHRVAIKVDRLYQGGRCGKSILITLVRSQGRTSVTNYLAGEWSPAKPLKETTASRRPAVAVAGPPYPVAAATPTDHGKTPLCQVLIKPGRPGLQAGYPHFRPWLLRTRGKTLIRS